MQKSELPIAKSTSTPFPELVCTPDASGHCITCSDEAIPVKVLQIDLDTGLAQVEVANTIEEVDITLLDTVTPGDIILVHGGVAIGAYAE
jgi:hydrogenase maturation factor